MPILQLKEQDIHRAEEKMKYSALGPSNKSVQSGPGKLYFFCTKSMMCDISELMKAGMPLAAPKVLAIHMPKAPGRNFKVVLGFDPMVFHIITWRYPPYSDGCCWKTERTKACQKGRPTGVTRGFAFPSAPARYCQFQIQWNWNWGERMPGLLTLD